MTRVDYKYGLISIKLVTNFHQVSDCQGDQDAENDFGIVVN